MKGKLQLRKPENWQDFETLCKKLWGEIWECSNIKKNGRSGQKQYGVDIYGIPNGESAYYGIQCKGKDDYSYCQLTEKEIDDELNKASIFQPPLKGFYFATTANKDAKIEEYIRRKNIESITQGGFSIDVFSWEDIVDLIEENQKTFNWYVHDFQYKDSYNIEINIVNNDKNNPFILYPKFYKTTKKYELSRPNDMNFLLSQMPKFNTSLFPFHNTSTNYQWCTLILYIKNIGGISIEDYKIDIRFNEEEIDELDTSYGVSNNPLLSDTMRAELHRNASQKREVFSYSNCSNGLLIQPKNNLVQKETDNFKFYVKPKYGITELSINWRLLAKNFSLDGECKLKVEAQIEDKSIVEYVDSEVELKPVEIIIEPKIVD
ncbi:hypothetical protein [Bacteroides sp. 519]|uniref:hypothetical protein n=1 Tax=Bacteroides sp. 519 TaxID=2302937 RepID=UPI0013D32594|nr:hypothetical protein [Bacteroides sp. 519]NDV56658.1 hypothetical protein [Bacteroides sp. 519]